MSDFEAKGYQVFAAEPSLRDWVTAARAQVLDKLDRPEHAHQWQCEGTWCVGLDMLDNDPEGRVDGVPLAGAAPKVAQGLFGPLSLHKAQVSVTRPGYPRPRDQESESAFRYRVKRDAAHVDGLLPVGPDRRRKLIEPHGWILGVALTEAAAEASPLVVWEGSHKLMGAALAEVLHPHSPETWAEVDLTDAYHSARKRCFEETARRSLPLKPGEAVLLHRHLLHGIASWESAATSEPVGRAIAYFRPEISIGWC